MSRLIYDFDTDDRNITFEVTYDYHPGSYAVPRSWIPESFCVGDVRVIAVEYFSLATGECIAVVKAADMQPDALAALNSEVYDHVLAEIEKAGIFCDCLVGHP